MISRKQRFHGQNDIRIVYRRGETVRSQTANMRFIRSNKQESYRCSVIVSKKVHKSAVVRNRIRRRVYEVIRELAPQIIGSPDLVITIYQVELATMPHPQVVLNIGGLLKKANLLKS